MPEKMEEKVEEKIAEDESPLSITITFEKKTGEIKKVSKGPTGKEIEAGLYKGKPQGEVVREYSLQYIKNSPGRWCLSGGNWYWCS